MKETLRLFKALPIKAKRKKQARRKILEITLKHGFIFSDEIFANYKDSELLSIIEDVKNILLSKEQMNSSFHKSWKKVRDSSIEQLVLEQMIHYITTYGFEALNIYNQDSVYIPDEKQEIPELKDTIYFTIIKGYTKFELKNKLLHLLSTGIALKEETMADIINICNYVEIKNNEIEQTKNKEVKIRLYDTTGLIPENPIEFLRLLIYKTTNKTLIIKDRNTIEKIKLNNNHIEDYFLKYKLAYGLEKLSSIFNRFKPLFLAFRTNKECKRIINRIRRLAKLNHKPMPEDFLNEVTAKIKKGEKIDMKILNAELSKVNTFRKIRLVYALKFRTTDCESIMYRIRNGKGFAKEYHTNNKDDINSILKIVLLSITNDIKKNINGKKIFIPEYIKYALPATEKQFTGNFPSGTTVSINKDMVFGIHWEDVENHRIDLDLSLMSFDGKIGWDSYYRNEDNSILFSGDITSAPKPNGASELFYVKRQKLESFLMYVNYYNYNKDVEVPMSIIIGKEQVRNMSRNYMINPNNVINTVQTKINQKQKILGLIISTTNGSKFIFSETDIGKNITASNNKFTDNARMYLFDFYKNTISLNDILKQAGAILVEDKTECDIDLSPECLEKDTIINLIYGDEN